MSKQRRFARAEEPTTTAQPESASTPAEPTMTVDRFIRGKGQLGEVFKTTVTLSDKKIIKRTVAEWDSMYDTWLKAPRG